MTITKKDIIDIIQADLRADAPEVFLNPANEFGPVFGKFLDELVARVLDASASGGVSNERAYAYVHLALLVASHLMEGCATALLLSGRVSPSELVAVKAEVK
jgi:hypothetical protein